MASLGCQPDHIWNQLNHKLLGTLWGIVRIGLFRPPGLGTEPRQDSQPLQGEALAIRRPDLHAVSWSPRSLFDRAILSVLFLSRLSWALFLPCCLHLLSFPKTTVVTRPHPACRRRKAALALPSVCEAGTPFYSQHALLLAIVIVLKLHLSPCLQKWTWCGAPGLICLKLVLVPHHGLQSRASRAPFSQCRLLEEPEALGAYLYRRDSIHSI